MVLAAFVCFALLLVAWVIAPGLDRSTPAVMSEPPAADARVAGASL